MSVKIKILLGTIVLMLLSMLYFNYSGRQLDHDPQELVVGTNAEYPPFSFYDTDIISGFDIDVVTEVARRLGKRLKIIDMPFDALIPALQTGMIHVIAAGMTPTQERAKMIFFTPVYFNGDPLVMVSRLSDCYQSLNRVGNGIVAVNEGFTAEYYVADNSEATLLRLHTVLEGLMAVETGRAVLFVTARSALIGFSQSSLKEKFCIVEIPDTSEQYALGVSLHYSFLGEKISRAINELLEDGTIEKLKKERMLV